MQNRWRYYRDNRAAAYWRAVTIKLLRCAGHSYVDIAEHYGISAERVRQICARPDPAAQLELQLADE
jgi:transposase